MSKKNDSGGFQFTPVAVQFSGDGDGKYDEWLQNLKRITMVAKSENWWIGDLLLIGEETFGAQCDQIMDDLGFEYQTLANMKWVSKKVDASRRREDLTWQHHVCVAKLDPDEQEKWLKRAADKKMSASTLKSAIKLKLQQKEDREQEESDDESRFRVILACITDEEMDALEAVRVPAAQNSVLFLLCPAERVRDAVVLLECWNFAFATTAIVHTGKADGKVWFRNQHKVIIVGTRGTINSPPVERLAPSILASRTRKNSDVPDELVATIEDMFPARGKSSSWCDLFTMQPREGWATPNAPVEETADEAAD